VRVQPDGAAEKRHEHQDGTDQGMSTAHAPDMASAIPPRFPVKNARAGRLAGSTVT
jgi:hypothetical protein